ncbi:unnamed protein product (macronuclear) [Paramecium tetraurelia]|uniref:Uncharacterized protein n=1 Tax=Paramecium tetraurelia TaxID=5888 RepID=A0C651_PARTE|nr:uncharacterized protein GSPATT00035397001 [Paramecium tetraurelia]CAK66268.1 unnamed protein product [Paramecium tetraurelia]|eukprot:XP_001433665.1 hypothetical protein (macronuclear) [Paramecium tetraurelia strain d4-2]
MFICCASNKKPKVVQTQTQIPPLQAQTKQPKYQIRTSNDQDQHSTNLTNMEGTNDKINLSLQEVEKFILHDKKTLEQERELVTKLIELPEKSHLIEFNWAIAYTNYIKNAGLHPGEISNKILYDKYKAKEELVLDKDYVLVNDQVWNVLVNIYKGGPMMTINDLDRKSEINILDQSLKVFASPSMNDLDIKQAKIRHLKQMSIKELQIVGLENEIYFCYLNSVLQCLMGIPQLNSYFLISSQSECKLFSYAYSLLLRKASKVHYKARIVAKELIKVLQKHFSIYEMHDSSELLLFILDKFKEEIFINNALQLNQLQQCQFKQSITFIDELFHGQLTSFIKCSDCNKISQHQDPFYDLSLPLVGKNFMQRKLTIQECLSNYFKEEMIDGGWTCSFCNQKFRTIKRRVKISFAPNILVLQLKRFQVYPLQKKIKEPVVADMELNIKNFCVSEVVDTKYELHSMIVHSGTIDQGHYVAVVKRNQNFYLFNDDEIERLSLNQINRIDSAYLFMYHRKSD